MVPPRSLSIERCYPQPLIHPRVEPQTVNLKKKMPGPSSQASTCIGRGGGLGGGGGGGSSFHFFCSNACLPQGLHRSLTPPAFWGEGHHFFAYCGRCVCIWTWVLKTFFLHMDPLTNGRGPRSAIWVPLVSSLAPLHVRTWAFSAVSRLAEPHQSLLGWACVRHLVTIRVLEHSWGPTLWPLGPCSPRHGPPETPEIAIFLGLFSGTSKFLKFDFFRNHPLAPGMGLCDHLVTIQVLEHPWGPTQWPLGLCSPGQGPSKSPEIAVVYAVQWHFKSFENSTFSETVLFPLEWVWVVSW